MAVNYLDRVIIATGNNDGVYISWFGGDGTLYYYVSEKC